MPYVLRPNSRRFPKAENLTEFEHGMHCNGYGQPVVHFDGAGKAEVLRALLPYFQTPCITGFGRIPSEPLTGDTQTVC